MRRAPFAIARYGLGIVFFLFGIMQWLDPASWFGYLPVHGVLGLSDTALVFMNGTFDLFLGALLLAGLFTRVAAGLAALHLAGVIMFLGFNDVAVRDFGLLVVALAVLWNGADEWCADMRLSYPHRFEWVR